MPIKTVFVAPGGGYDKVSIGTTERREPGTGEITRKAARQFAQLS